MGLAAAWAALVEVCLLIGRLLVGIRGAVMATKLGKALAWGLFIYAGGIIARALRFLGITLVANEYLTPNIMPYITGPLLGLPATWQTWMVFLHMDRGLTIMISAIIASTANNISIRKRQDNIWQPL